MEGVIKFGSIREAIGLNLAAVRPIAAAGTAFRKLFPSPEQIHRTLLGT